MKEVVFAVLAITVAALIVVGVFLGLAGFEGNRDFICKKLFSRKKLKNLSMQNHTAHPCRQRNRRMTICRMIYSARYAALNSSRIAAAATLQSESTTTADFITTMKEP